MGCLGYIGHKGEIILSKTAVANVKEKDKFDDLSVGGWIIPKRILEKYR
jgi:hypothetical protein